MSIFALIIVLMYRPDQQPIMGDRAYFLYMAQEIFRAEPVYQTTTLGYTPLGILVSAATMHLGECFGVAGYLVPRYFGVLIAVMSCALLYLITRRATRSPFAAIIAGLSLLQFDLFTVLSASNLEPKLLVQFLSLIAVISIQHGSWPICGLSAGLAAMTWQPAALLIGAPSFALCLAQEPGKKKAAVVAYVGGCLAGLLPALLYLTLTMQWEAFLKQAVVFKLQSRPEIISRTLWQSMKTLLLMPMVAVRVKGLPLLVLACLGFFWHQAGAFRRGWKYARRCLFHPRYGGLVLATFAFLAYHTVSSLTAIEMHGAGDMLPGMYLMAFWATWCLYRICVRGISMLNSSPFLQSYRCIRTDCALTVVIMVLAATNLLDACRYAVRYTVDEQTSFVRSIVSGRDSFIAINAPEFYVLAERRSPWRSLFVKPYFTSWMEELESSGCPLKYLANGTYEVIVIKDIGPDSENVCLDAIKTELGGNYRKRLVSRSTPKNCKGILQGKAFVGTRFWRYMMCQMAKASDHYSQTEDFDIWIFSTRGSVHEM